MYEMCRKLIEKGRTDGLAEKIGKLYLFDQLSEKQYTELMGLLKKQN